MLGVSPWGTSLILKGLRASGFGFKAEEQAGVCNLDKAADTNLTVLLVSESQCGRFRQRGEKYESGMKYRKFTVALSMSLIFNDNDATKVAATFLGDDYF